MFKSANLAVLLVGSAALLAVSGCKSGTNNEPPTAEKAKFFKGAEPTAEERAGMVKEQADAAAYRRAHPKEFPNEPPAPAPATIK